MSRETLPTEKVVTTHEFDFSTDFCVHCGVPRQWVEGGAPWPIVAVSMDCPKAPQKANT